jgi:predicted HTH transcriptional regulator
MIRYPDEELEHLLNDIESDIAERKESWKGDAPDTGRQAVCAFANDLPDHRRLGVLFVGAKNDGAPSCLAITDELLRTLSDIRTDGNILPPPSILVDKRTLKGSEIAVVTVQPSDSPPVRYKGRIWVRKGVGDDGERLTYFYSLGKRRPCPAKPASMHPAPFTTLLSEESTGVIFSAMRWTAKIFSPV